ncbi:tetratricopeptide repeat protein, partial [bacterium]|nr:tetratricopeptide repeat protein [bacterium]
VSLLGIAQFFGVMETLWGNLPWEPELGKRVFSTMWNPNFLAGLLVLTLPVILGLAKTSGRRWLEIAFLSAYFVNFTCLLLTNSWGGWIAFLVSTAFLATIETSRSGFHFGNATAPRVEGENPVGIRKSKSAIIVLLTLCVASAIAFFAYKGETVVGSTVGASERGKMFRSAMMLIKRHPLGLGLGNFAVFENEFEHKFIQPMRGITKTWRQDRDNLLHNSFYCHNEFLETALEMGFAGLMLFLWLVFTAGRLPFRGAAPRGLSGASSDSERTCSQQMMLATVAGFMAIVVQSVVSYPMRVPTTIGALAVVLGLWAPRRVALTIGVRIPRAVGKLLSSILIFAAVGGCLQPYRPLEAERHFVKGMEHLLAGEDHRMAIQEFDRAIDLGLPRYTVYFKLGESELALNRYDDALKTFREALEIQPFHEYSFFGVAEALRGLKRPAAAIENYGLAIKYEPRFLEAYIELSRLQRSRNEPESALKTLNAGLHYLPGSRVLLLDASVTAMALGQGRRAREHVERLMVIDPTDVIAEYNLRLLQDAERNEAPGPSRRLASRMIDSEGADWILKQSQLGAVFFQKGKFAAARGEFQNVLDRFSEYPSALSNMGTTYYLEGNHAQAERFFLKAIRLAPNRASFRIALANIYSDQQNWQAAESQLRIACQLAPDDNKLKERLNWVRRQMSSSGTTR